MKDEKIKLIKSMRLLVLGFGLLLTSCSSNEDDTDQDDVQDYAEVALSAEIDRASDAMDDFAIQIYEDQESQEADPIGDSKTRALSGFPNCASIVVDIAQHSRDITIDFGNDGCVINGNSYKGKILLSYERNLEAHQINIVMTLKDFYFNNKNIQGGKTIVRVLANENGNPEFTNMTDMSIVWPNGAEGSRNGIIVREWVEGFGSEVWSDNVFEVTGYWTTTFVNGRTHSYEVIEPLRREELCHYFVSGTFSVERTNFSGVFDFGHGDCDNQAKFTFENGFGVDTILN